jgi:hypothetical protein
VAKQLYWQLCRVSFRKCVTFEVKFEDFWGETEFSVRVQRANERGARRLLAVQRLKVPSG